MVCVCFTILWYWLKLSNDICTNVYESFSNEKVVFGEVSVVWTRGRHMHADATVHWTIFQSRTQRTTVNNNLRKVIVVKSAKMDSVTALYKDLKTEWDKSAPNLRKCGSLLDQLKVLIYYIKFVLLLIILGFEINLLHT